MPQLLHYLKQILPVDLIQTTRLFCRRNLLKIFRQQDGSLPLAVAQPSAGETAALVSDPLAFSQAEVIHISAPFCLGEVPEAIQKRMGTFEVGQPYVYEMANARLIGDRATGFSDRGQLITDTAVPSFYGLEQSTSARALVQNALIESGLSTTLPSKLQSKPKVPVLDQAFSLVNPWSHNYFHWLIDCLPRLEGYECYGTQLSAQSPAESPVQSLAQSPAQSLAQSPTPSASWPAIIVPQDLKQWQADSLRLLGYSPENCIRWQGKQTFVTQLVVSSFRRNSLSVLSPAACHWLKHRIVSAVQAQSAPGAFSSDALSSDTYSSGAFSPNVIISRRKATGRRLVNEDDVIQLLAPFGFVAYTLEEMSFADQVRLFAQAQIVISPHGAGLVNMIFSTNLCVIELFSSPINPIFFTLAKALKFEYACITCQTIAKKYNTKRNDILVDISQLKNTVKHYLN